MGAAREACSEVAEEARLLAEAAPMELRQLDVSQVDWEELDSYADRNVFQTREWLAFIEKTQDAKPVIASLSQDGNTVGFFTGLLIRRYGVRILGSPFRGWTTSYMGFNLADGVSRRAAVEALLPFAFRSLGCMHVELRDRDLSLDDVERPGVHYALGADFTGNTVFEVDLRPTEEELFARMSSACRRCIRKAKKVGVTIEEADDLGFADDYYAQLRDVFAKQSLVPTYDKGRVTELIRQLHPTGHLLLLRARNAEGRCIATGIFPATNRWMYFWGGASWRSDQILRPNEALMWHAMKYWKSRGVEICDLGGATDYKRKWGPVEASVPSFRISRNRAISAARLLMKKGIKVRQVTRGRMTAFRSASRES